MYYEQALGWLIELSPLALVVIASIATVLLRLRKGQQIAFLQPGLLLKPSAEWGPRFCICLYVHAILCLGQGILSLVFTITPSLPVSSCTNKI